MTTHLPPGLPNTCPHCGAKPCLPFWRKLTLGPSGIAKCPTCGFGVAVHPINGAIALAPPALVLVLVSVGLLTNVVLALGLLLPAFGLTVILYLEWVGLIYGGISNPKLVAEQKAIIAAKRTASRHSGGRS